MNDPTSRIERVKLQGRETVTHLADVDDLIIHRDPSTGGMVIEFLRWGERRNPLESYRISLCPEDYQRIREGIY
jgi:hypothetical protein